MLFRPGSKGKPTKDRVRAFSFVQFIGVVAAGMVAGCGTSISTPQVGAVNFTDVKGNLLPSVLSIPHGTTVYLDVVVTHDIESLGVDWTVTCSSSLPAGTLPAGTVDTSCGVFSPYHTLSGPIPTYPGVTGIVTQFTAPAVAPKAGTVTITVHSTSLPSSTSSITLNIT